MRSKGKQNKKKENVYDRQDIELVNDFERDVKLIENNNFEYALEFDDDMFGDIKQDEM